MIQNIFRLAQQYWVKLLSK